MLAATSLTACGATDRLKSIGAEPKQSAMISPTDMSGYKPVQMPMPVKPETARQANSLWTGASQGFFKDQRADEIGDILTVVIDIDDKGEIKNETSRSRSASETAGIPNLLGLETQINKVLPEGTTAGALASADTDSSSKGTGEIGREEKIEMKLAATVSQILPNGNMVIHGSQEVRVNFENRILKHIQQNYDEIEKDMNDSLKDIYKKKDGEDKNKRRKRRQLSVSAIKTVNKNNTSIIVSFN
jgi:flagellar L-ring protein precursor FlgH